MEHLITPPPELVEQWYDAIDNSSTSWKQELTTKAARWGADLELEAGRDYMQNKGFHGLAKELLAARRPKPPSLAEQGLMALEDGDLGPGASLTPVEVCIIRSALERLQELEGTND